MRVSASSMMSVASAAGCPIVLMHHQGEPETMQIEPHYDDVVVDVEWTGISAGTERLLSILERNITEVKDDKKRALPPAQPRGAAPAPRSP